MKIQSLESKVREQNKYKVPYNHARWEPQRRFLRFLIRWIGFTLLARVDRVEGMENVPKTGPAILMINHIAFIDPIVVLHLLPRNIVPMAKVEVFSYPGIGIFPKIWHVIPVKREEVDRQAIRYALDILAAGEMILVAPEGTRGPALKEGKEGVAYLASRSGVPVVPVAIKDSAGFPALRFTSRWKGPGATVKFGRPFRYKPEYIEHRGDLRKMTDEAMYVLASLLPEEMRGHYSDISSATLDTIELL
ncbi:MAG: 1-acyl-sn-glycerol-3-phosphate acyltransferase [Chloroflexi bacterium]|nr:MAG: 1-acyl-sn-glycerol-3-phosphate acyltransferase [Chloroflexota bacterium]